MEGEEVKYIPTKQNGHRLVDSSGFEYTKEETGKNVLYLHRNGEPKKSCSGYC